MKYLKYLQTANDFESFKNSEEYILPNVSYVKADNVVYYNPFEEAKPSIIMAHYNATEDNLVAFNGASNIKSMKVNGTPIEIEPIKNEINTFDVLGENISLDMGTNMATFPESYLIKSPVSSWSFKAKDPNYTINENTYVCMLGMMDSMTMAQPMPITDIIGYGFTINDGVTLEAVDTFLNEMNMQIQSGVQMGFTFCEVDMNSETYVFIDTEHQINVTTGGLPTYSFDSEGLYDVEIELSDPALSMQFAETSLISIEIGDGITSIGEYTFSDCSGLNSVTIPDSVTSIGEQAFAYCSGLNSVTIPDSVTSIGDRAFSNCRSLTEVHIGSGVTEIGEQAFYGCSGLTSLHIGSGVTSIGDGAFNGCTSLNKITCNAITAPTIDSNVFLYVRTGGVLKVPTGSDYSTWMSTSDYYLGKYNWTIEYI